MINAPFTIAIAKLNNPFILILTHREEETTVSEGENTKHTPGPWVVDGPASMDIRCRVYRVINSDRFPAAFVPAWDQAEPGEVDGTEEAVANARLIATAPDLLAAAKDALAGWRYIRATHGELYGVGWDRVEQALTAAISRASR